MNQPDKKPYDRSSSFEKQWGSSLLRNGFTQIPNTLIRGIGELNLSPFESIVAFYILSIGSKGYAPAKRVAKELGISEKSVRKLFQSLELKGYIRRIYKMGEANRFDVDGLIRATQTLEKNNQTARYDIGRGLALLGIGSTPKSTTNKDSNIHKDKKEGRGHKLFIKAKEMLKARRPDGL